MFLIFSTSVYPEVHKYLRICAWGEMRFHSFYIIFEMNYIQKKKVERRTEITGVIPQLRGILTKRFIIDYQDCTIPGAPG